MPAETKLFRCLKDNYGVLIHDPASGATAAIDAPEAAPVEAALKATGWKLTDILVTHHHADHTGGIEELKARHKCRVVAPKAEAGKIPAVDETVREGDTVKVGNLSANVIETPGHTSGHITFWFHGDKLAFAGDTLFSIGCGRVIEGTPEMMWASLKKLRDLPGDTAGLLRPRIHAGEHQVRADHRAGQRGAEGARRGGREADRRWPVDHPDHDRRGEGGQRLPARRRAGGRSLSRAGRQAGRRGVHRDQGKEE